MKKLYIIMPIIIISLLTIGFSAFENSLLVDDIAVEVRVKKDIRVTEISNVTTNNGGISISYDYNVNNINGTINLPNSNSSVTYQVKVTNIGNTDMGILKVTDLPSNLTYEITDYEESTKLCNSSNQCSGGIDKTFYITIKYKDGIVTDNQINFIATFNFKGFHNINYNNAVVAEVIDEGSKSINLGDNAPDEVSLSGTYTNYSYIKPNLVLEGVTTDIIVTAVGGNVLPWYELCDSNSNTFNCKLIIAETPYADNVSSTNVSASTGINFSANSSTTNGRGLYYTGDPTKTEDMNGDGEGDRVYYYRGAVTNNFVILDDYCWRIVRINEDASIKLIYGGTPTGNSCPQSGTNVSIGSGKYNDTYKDNAYVGYMFGDAKASSYEAAHKNTNNSSIKDIIDDWYNTNLADSAAYLGDYPFCNDRSITSGNGYSTSVTKYSAYNRFYYDANNQAPNIKCTQDNDKFSVSTENGNGALKYPIALLTADEANYAGTRFTSSSRNSDCYLYTNSYYWLMTPIEYDTDGVYMYYMLNTGNIRNTTAGNTRYTFYVRPVINLASNVIFSSGAGTYNNPYKVSLP